MVTTKLSPAARLPRSVHVTVWPLMAVSSHRPAGVVTTLSGSTPAGRVSSRSTPLAAALPVLAMVTAIVTLLPVVTGTGSINLVTSSWVACGRGWVSGWGDLLGDVLGDLETSSWVALQQPGGGVGARGACGEPVRGACGQCEAGAAKNETTQERRTRPHAPPRVHPFPQITSTVTSTVAGVKVAVPPMPSSAVTSTELV